VIQFACAKLHSGDETIGNPWLQSDRALAPAEAPRKQEPGPHGAECGRHPTQGSNASHNGGVPGQRGRSSAQGHGDRLDHPSSARRPASVIRIRATLMFW
jgi:hypothetical protein